MYSLIRGRNYRWTGLILVLVVALVSLAGPGAAQLADFPELSRRFAPGREPASYVIVIDMSGSMNSNGYFPIVKQAVHDFVKFLPNGDYLSILGFNESTRPLIMPQFLQSDRTGLLRFINAIPNPRPKSKTAPEQFTDIGRALKATLKELRAPGAPRVQFVLFLTDGNHEPGPGSEFPQKTGPAWNELRSSASQALKDKLVQVTPLALGTKTGVELVQKVFPGSMPIPVSDRSQLVQYFMRKKSELQRDRLELLVAGELQKTSLLKVAAPPLLLRHGTTTRYALTVTKPFDRLTGRISTRLLAPRDYVVEDASTGAGPMQSSNYRITAKGQDYFWQPERQTPCLFTIQLTIVAEPQAEISRLGLNPRYMRTITVQGSTRSGQPLMVLVGIVVGFLLLVAVAVRQSLLASLPPCLAGRLVCIEGPTAELPDIVLQGHRRFTIGGSDGDNIRLDGEETPSLVRLEAMRAPRAWSCRLLCLRACSESWINHAEYVILQRPAIDDPVIDAIALTDGDAAETATAFEPMTARTATEGVERRGAIAERRLQNGMLIIIGAYTFRWDEHYDPKEAVDGNPAKG